ncbi:hypothetical protein K432DRAFT_411035 [Lepidopterella palustris CBS 459.81]|uniref:Uncharacterized protein n=1 Tax=Lepidopterella palustris CBS 459.81 TaxID=1314670 RepID=A0A8E2J8U2_9PEZI|nr:hypothetical protein K432DRAFT_411035 [Lepidopterella palustris CBS 459.81]
MRKVTYTFCLYHIVLEKKKKKEEKKKEEKKKKKKREEKKKEEKKERKKEKKKEGTQKRTLKLVAEERRKEKERRGALWGFNLSIFESTPPPRRSGLGPPLVLGRGGANGVILNHTIADVEKRSQLYRLLSAPWQLLYRRST